MNKGYPITDLVILAGGQARRMNGLNKLLQQFDGDTQLLKIHQKLKSSVSEIWVNSHRDYSIYQSIVPDIKCFQDDASGFRPAYGDEKCMVTCKGRLCFVYSL